MSSSTISEQTPKLPEFNAEKALNSIKAQELPSTRPILEGYEWLQGKIGSVDATWKKVALWVLASPYFLIVPVAFDAIIGLMGRAVDYSRKQAATKELINARNNLNSEYTVDQFKTYKERYTQSALTASAISRDTNKIVNEKTNALIQYNEAVQKYSEQVVEATKKAATFDKKLEIAQQMVKTIVIGVDSLQQSSLIQDLGPAVAKALIVDLGKELAMEIKVTKDVNTDKLAAGSKAITALIGAGEASTKAVAEQVINSTKKSLGEKAQEIIASITSEENVEAAAKVKDKELQAKEAVITKKLEQQLGMLGIKQQAVKKADLEAKEASKKYSELVEKARSTKQESEDFIKIGAEIKLAGEQVTAKNAALKVAKEALENQQKAVIKLFVELSQVKVDLENVGQVVKAERNAKANLFTDFGFITRDIDGFLKIENSQEEEKTAELEEDRLAELELELLKKFNNNKGNVDVIISLIEDLNEDYDIKEALFANFKQERKAASKQANEDVAKEINDRRRLGQPALSKEEIQEKLAQAQAKAEEKILRREAQGATLFNVIDSILNKGSSFDFRDDYSSINDMEEENQSLLSEENIFEFPNKGNKPEYNPFIFEFPNEGNKPEYNPFSQEIYNN